MNEGQPLRPIEILMVEDSSTDAMMAQEALQYAKLLNNVHVLEDGVEAMAFLRRGGRMHPCRDPT